MLAHKSMMPVRTWCVCVCVSVFVCLCVCDYGSKSALVQIHDDVHFGRHAVPCDVHHDERVVCW